MICPLWSQAMIKFSTCYLLMLMPLPIKGLLLFIQKLCGVFQRLPPKRDYVGDWSICGTVQSLKHIEKSIRNNVAWLMISYTCMLLNKHTIVRRSRTIRVIRNFSFQPSTSTVASDEHWSLISYM